MCFEYAIAFAILFAIAVAAICLCVKVGKLEDENETLHEAIVNQEDIIREHWGTIEELEQELAKKNSLISILRNEIEEKENAK